MLITYSPSKPDPHLNVVRGWQQPSKGMPAGAMPSVAKAHAEVPPWATREVDRPSRNLENRWRTRAATGGMESLTIPKTNVIQHVKGLPDEWRCAGSKEKRRMKSDAKESTKFMPARTSPGKTRSAVPNPAIGVGPRSQLPKGKSK